MFSCERFDAMVAPQLEAALYWLMETTPLAIGR